MLEGREFRELLIADVALMQGVASAGDVAAALQRYWQGRGKGGASLAEELVHIARLAPGALRPVETEVDRLLAAAGGDAKIALDRRGGLDRSVHLALGKEGRELTRMLSVLGVPIRAPVRQVPADRYADFEVAGRGGMGVVYAAIDTEMNRRVAFKMVRTDLGPEEMDLSSSPLQASKPEKHSPQSEQFEQLKARLVQEAWVTGGLEHPGIVPVYEIGQTPGGVPYYTMRYVRGERTLANAIAERKGAAFEERLSLLEPFLKVCDTLRYAHDKGVVHRDLKPANVALGQYGEVVLLDWGLARLEGREDVASSAWQARVAEMREDAGFQTLEGGAMGTAGYMSPEATLGNLAEVDQRSDVYSLGAMLFEILTGRLPFAFKSYVEYASLLLREDPGPAREVDPSVPEALSALCARALSRDKQKRPASAQELATAVRAWQTENALDREIEGLLRDARAALDAAAEVEGEARLVQVDRAAAALAQVEKKRPGAADLAALRRRGESLREEGIGQRERAATRRLLRRVAVGGLAAAAVAALVVVTIVEGKRKEAEDARADAVTAQKATQAALVEKGRALDEKGAALVEVGKERDAKGKALAEKAAALDDVLRLADSKKVADLLSEADRLWPLEPAKVEAMAAWLGKAKALLRNRDGHRERLRKIREAALPYTEEAQERDQAEDRKRIEAGKKRLEEIEAEKGMVEGDDAEAKKRALDEQAKAAREEVARLEAGLSERRTWAFANPNVDWHHQVVADLLAGLDRLDGAGKGEGALARVERRHGFVTTVKARSIDEQAETWKQTIEEIAASSRYGGLRIQEQLGLVPLGPDPDSGLFEFAHLGSGSIPKRDEKTKRLVYVDDAAVVLVLIPRGTFKMGAQKEDPKGPNYDPHAEADESPVHEVTLTPFFLAKQECTQAQWKAMTEGEDPSGYKAGGAAGDENVKQTLRNPVENVSWEDCDLWLSRNRLVLPTESQWECACRAGTDTPWLTGRDVPALGKVANIADRHCREHGGPATWPYTVEVDDGHTVHAPVGSFAENAFGLDDVHGNVLEWCRDAYRPYASKAVTDPQVEGSGSRVGRGGSCYNVAAFARSAYRYRNDPGFRYGLLGVRPASPLRP